MNTENVQNNVGASQEAVVAQPEIDLVNKAREKALEIAAGTKAEAQNTNEISFTEKAKEMACKAWESVKEFSQEIWEDEEGRKVLTDLAIAIGVRLAFRNPLTAGIAIGIVGYRAWQEIKSAKEAYTNN